PGLHKQRRLAVAYLAYSPPSRILVTEVLSNFRYEEALHQRAFQLREQALWAEQVLLRREALHELVEQGRLGRLPIAVAHLGFVMCFHERLPSCRPPRSTYTTFLTHRAVEDIWWRLRRRFSIVHHVQQGDLPSPDKVRVRHRDGSSWRLRGGQPPGADVPMSPDIGLGATLCFQITHKRLMLAVRPFGRAGGRNTR